MAALPSPCDVVPDPARVPPAVLGVLRTLRAAGKQAFLAGGAVRDLLRLALGQAAAAPQDFDVASDALPEEVLRLFPKVIPTGVQHGTVTVLAREGAEEQKVEVTTFRGEGPYLDGRRPSAVTFLGEIEADLARRDFTVNAIAWDPLQPGAAGLRDPFGGQRDLRRRRLRAVGDAAARFAEDGLRPLRAVRFACTLRLALEPATARAIAPSLPVFAKVAQERVRDELLKLLVRGAPPSRGLRLLARTGLLGAIAPELAPADPAARERWRRALRAVDAAPADPVVRLAALLQLGAPAPAAALTGRLKLSRREADRIALLLRERALPYAPGWTDGACRRAIARIGPEALPQLWALRRAALAVGEGGAGAQQSQAALEARFAALLEARPPLAVGDLAIGGAELMSRLGLPPGPLVGRLLSSLLEQVLDDPSLNTQELLHRRSSALLAELSTGHPQA